MAEQVLKLVLEENGQTKGFEFDLPEITIGRTNDNAVKIADALSSRHHCQVKRTPEGFVVTDLKSRNGTKLNGAPLTAEHLLRPGDRIEVGDSIVHFERRAGAPGAGTSGAKTKRREKPPASPEGETQFADAAAPAAGGEAPQVTLADGPKLEVTAGEGTGQVVAIAALPFVVGRKKGLGLVVVDAEVSNEHCMIVEDAGGLHLVDLGSSNGTFVDGERLRGRTPLRRGATLRLGATLTLRVLPAPAAGQSKRLEKKPTSDRTLTPKSDRHEKPGGSARSRAEQAAKSDKVAKPAPGDDVEEVESLDGLGGDDEPEAKPAPAPKAAPKGAKPTANLGKGDDAARAASVVADEADVADADFAARLEAAAATNDKVKAAGGGGVAVLLVAGLVVVLAAAAVLASLVSGQPERDPSPDDALVDNWSFEEVGPASDPVPGWVLGAGAATTTDEVRNGRRALALTVSPDAAPGARAEARTTDVRVQAGKAYRVRAGALLAPRTGVGLRVDWSRDGAVGAAGASRSSWAVVVDPAQQGGAWRDIAGTVVAPKGASLARVVVVGLGTQDGPAGVVRVDRIHMSLEPQEPQDEGLEGPAGLVVHGDPRGVLVIARAGRELASELALCLDPADSLADQAAARVDQPLALQTDGSLLAFGAIPDPGRARVDYQLAVRPAAAGLGLQWSAGQRAAPVTLRMVVPSLDAVRPVELDGKPVGDVPPGGLELEGVNEMAWGKGANQVSFRFSTPARLRLEPQGSGARLLLTLVPRPLATGEAGIGIDLGAASTGTREALRRLVAEAEEAAARGELARALAAWRRLQAQFPHETALVARADREARAIAARADRLLEVAAWVAAESREVASPALLAAARSILADLERDHAGAPQVDRARREVSAVEGALQDAERRKGAARVRALVERAQSLRQQGHVETARLIYQGIVEQFGKDVEGVADAAAKLAALPAPGAGK